VTWRLAFVASLLLAGCGGAPAPGSGPAPRLSSPDAEQEVSSLLEAAVTGDTRGTATDSLYSPAATVIANGNLRLSTPRLAGVQLGGSAAVTTSEVSVREGTAWALVEYRWFSTEQNQVHQGRATFVFAPRKSGHGWWIVHAHSSTAR
jgi:hypothetical protein